MSVLGWVVLAGIALLAAFATVGVVLLARTARGLAFALNEISDGVARLGADVQVLDSTIGAARLDIDDLRGQSLPLLADARAALRRTENTTLKADAQVEALLESAQAVVGTADAASRLAYLTLANPAIKVLAFFRGTTRAVRELARPTPAPPIGNGRRRDDRSTRSLPAAGERAIPSRSSGSAPNTGSAPNASPPNASPPNTSPPNTGPGFAPRALPAASSPRASRRRRIGRHTPRSKQHNPDAPSSRE